MLSPSTIDALRQLLKRGLERLDKIETATPRTQKKSWYQIEYHLPPFVVAVASTLVLYLTLLWGTEFSFSQLIALGVFVLLLVGLFVSYVVADHPALSKDDDAMGLLAVLFFTSLFFIKLISLFAGQPDWFSVYVTPVSIAPLLVTLLLHSRIAIVMSFIVAVLFGYVNSFSLELTIMGTIGCVTAVALVSRARTAHHVARAGLFVGAAQMLVVFFIAVTRKMELRFAIIDLVSAFLSGIFSAFISLGALPFLEGFFSRVSNLRLLELSDVNHPLLKRMSLEAPGTYHHSLVVAALAEDAANAIGANGLLCRVGAYFHDIGKMVKAEYFIENQGNFGNPHDQVSPSLSKLVITSHVKEGIALAHAHKLDQQVVNFIPQHHGTSQIEYFYRKALKLEEKEEDLEKEEVSEETYRYPGPKPQSKETGIVMLADSVEAAGRTIEDPSHQRYKTLVYKIINKKLFDGQLDETPLTLRDLHIVAERFTATLQSVHHDRIPYPDEMFPKKDPKDELSPPKS